MPKREQSTTIWKHAHTPTTLSYGLSSRKYTSQISQYVNSKPKQTIEQQKNHNINQEFLVQRRENILNTKFNVRKNRLIAITKENKQIHQRINAQKSIYSSQELTRSFDSRCSLRSSISKSSIRNKTIKPTNNPFHTKPIKQKNKTITIQSHNIRNINKQHIQKFASIFQKKSQHQISLYSSISKKTEKHFRSIKQNANILPPLKGDGFLHRIAEQLQNNKIKPIKKLLK